ncbi:MAG: recombinase family protein [Pseudonocardiales bacterium]|nr:recombinase family protein [Pseudonocardiales bacterium]MBV9031989.1 recombinase family protein [Pseudonocardiales bacterium]
MTASAFSRGTVRRAAIYCRISLDRAGAGLGVARQQEDCRELAERLGWPVADVYVDNDVSAYSGKPRPAWQQLLAHVESGTVDAVLCWHVDRLTRSPRELEDVIDLADRHGLALATVTGDIDLQSPTGRMVARLLGASARYESEHKGERQRRQIQQAAEAGHQVAGGRRPYGYALERGTGRITATVDLVEGPIVSECARRVLAGEAIASITRDLNQRGVLTSAGNSWNRTTLRRMLCSARISGRREHIPTDSYEGVRPLVGEIVSTESDWPRIISVAESDRLRALLTRPDRRLTTGGARKHLLSGILHCARCGQPMVGRSSRGVLRYVCNKNPDGGKGACGRIFITSAPTDDHIRNLVLSALDSPEMVARLRHRDQPEPDLHARIRADEDELEALAADHGNGEISRAEWRAARGPIVVRLDAARERLATSTQTTALDGFVGTYEDMLARWTGANVSQRRAVITAVLEKVMVHPATVMGCNRFDSDRLEPLWRG